MNINIQIISLIFSFLFGVLYFYLIKINLLIVKNIKNSTKYLINTLFILNIVLIYNIVNYKINNGFFHIYFLLLITLGFMFSIFINKYVNLMIQKLKKNKKLL